MSAALNRRLARLESCPVPTGDSAPVLFVHFVEAEGESVEPETYTATDGTRHKRADGETAEQFRSRLATVDRLSVQCPALFIGFD